MIRWMSLFLDAPPELLPTTSTFWTQVSATTPGQPIGAHDEFVPLEPDGDPCLWLQRLDDGPVACHPDLYVEDVAAAARDARDLGATVLSEQDGLIVLRSPGGLGFCLVRWRGQDRRPAPVGPPGRRSHVDQLCLDIPPGRYDEECAFWAATTGFERYDEGADEFERLRRPEGAPYALLLQRLDDERERVGAHIDLSADDREAETKRHQALGATVLRRTEGWTVMRDPAGMTYCITRRRPFDV